MAANAAPGVVRTHTLPLETEKLYRLNLLAILTGILLTAGLIYGARFLYDPDTFWHIRSGLDIWAAKSFPHTDPYSHTFLGEPWIAKEWASQLLLAGAYSLGEWRGVVLLTVFAITLSGGLAFWFLSETVRPLVAAAIVLVAVYLSSITFLARPHLLILPIVVTFVHFLWKDAQAARPPRFWLLGLLWLWANMHGSFTLGFVFAFLATGQFLFSGGRGKDRDVTRWAVFLALCPLVTLVHPYGHEAILSTFIQANNDASLFIGEWKAFSADLFPVHEQALLLLVFAALLSGFRARLMTTVFVVLLLHMFFVYARFAIFLFMLLPLVVCYEAANQFAWLRPKRTALKWFSTPGPLMLSIAAVVGVAIAGITINASSWVPRAKVSPFAALAAADAYGVEGNVLNAYPFGGGADFPRRADICRWARRPSL